ncbi:hypothetical protein MAJ_01036, partial [Metarhizium majus ARSEF 297]
MSDKKILLAARFLVEVVHPVCEAAVDAKKKKKKKKNGDKTSQQSFGMSSDNMKEVAPVFIHAIAEYADGKAKKGDQTTKQGPGTSSDDATESISSPVAAATTPSRTGAKDGDKTTEGSGSKFIAKMWKESIKFAPKVVDILVEQQKKASQEASRKA